MLARSLNKLEHQDFGYQVQGRVLVALQNPPTSYTRPKLAVLYRHWKNGSVVCPESRGPGWLFTTRSPTIGAT
jgi:hypothetical protein